MNADVFAGFVFGIKGKKAADGFSFLLDFGLALLIAAPVREDIATLFDSRLKFRPSVDKLPAVFLAFEGCRVEAILDFL